MSLLTGMNDILKNEAAIEAANDMTLFDEELALEADEFIDAMVDGEGEYEHPDDIDLIEEEDEEDDLLNEDLDIDDETATEAAALTGQSFLQSLLLNDDPITTKDGSIGYQDSAANYKDNYSNSFANDNDAIKTENGSVGQKNTAANYKENFSAEFANDNDNIKTEDGSLGPKTSKPNPAIESAMFFGDVMGEEVAMEGLIKNFKEKISAKRDAKRADILSKMGVTDIDTNKFNELYNQGKLDQAMKMAANFGKKLEDGLKKLEDKSDIKAAKRLIKTNSALMIGLETDKKVAEYVKGGMSEKDARKLVVKEMKKKAEKIEDPAQEAFITDCIDLVVAFEASVGQNDTAADHSDNYSGGDLDDTDPIDTEDGEDVGDEKASANPATESDLEAELQLLNDTLLGDEDDDLDL